MTNRKVTEYNQLSVSQWDTAGQSCQEMEALQREILTPCKDIHEVTLKSFSYIYLFFRMREAARKIEERHFSNHATHVEFLPVEWRSKLTLDGGIFCLEKE